jgi:predicted TIM-barrel fold metal-dependent hydrolase
MNRREFLAAAGGMAALAGCGGIPTRDDSSYGAWDNHSHIAGGPGKTPSERVDNLLKLADRVGVERLCLHLGMEVSDKNTSPTPGQIRQDNDAVLEAVRHAGNRAVGYVYLNPNHLEFSLQEFDRCVRDGPMVGVKLWVAKRCSAPELDPIVRRAAEHKAVIYQHTWLKVGNGNGPGESTPFDVVELAKRHPDVRLLCGHAGGDWERGIRAIRSTKNVLLEIAGSDPTSGFVEMAVRELGADRIVYGSDVHGRSFASQLAKVRGADIPDSAKRLILRENLRGLLAPIMKAKGIA